MMTMIDPTVDSTIIVLSIFASFCFGFSISMLFFYMRKMAKPIYPNVKLLTFKVYPDYSRFDKERRLKYEKMFPRGLPGSWYSR